MTRILFDARSGASRRTSGWERYARELGRHLAPAPDVHVWAPATNSLRDRLASDWLGLPRQARGASVVHTPTFPPAPVLRGVEIVFTLHDLTWWRYPETATRLGRTYYRPLTERVLERATVVTHSSSVREEAIEHFGLAEDRVSVVAPGVTPLPLSPPARRERPYVLAVATLEPRKNLTRLAEAYEASGLPGEVDLVVIGRSAWGSAPRGVQLLGAVTDRELAAHYAGAVGLVCPSLYEGFGLPVVEAMAARLPVACSDIPVFREVAAEHAVYFDPREVDSIALALKALASGNPSAAQLDAAAAHASQFTWDAAANQLLVVYGRVLERGGHVR